MSREIGSEFWDVPVCDYENGLFPESTKWFQSGRSALQAIIAENDFHSVGIPSWCCDSIIKPFVDSGIVVQFYDKDAPSTEAVLVMDFFGYSTPITWEKFNGIVIRDVTHSLFTESHHDADYYFGSLRKWAGFWTGGYAWGFKQQISYEECRTEFALRRKQAMLLKENYILGKTDSKEYLKLFEVAEDELEKNGIFPADPEDIKNAYHLDVELIRLKRRANAQILLKEFDDIAIFKELRDKDCPMFVPIRAERRNELRKKLIHNAIYCPVHWPVSEYHQLNSQAKQLYDEELSLVCDQRYDENDMRRIINVINDFYRKERNNGI